MAEQVILGSGEIPFTFFPQHCPCDRNSHYPQESVGRITINFTYKLDLTIRSYLVIHGVKSWIFWDRLKFIQK